MKKLWLLLLPFAFEACQQANENHVYMLKQTDSLLQRNIDLLAMKTAQLFKQMHEKKQDTLEYFNANEWYIKADSIHSITTIVNRTLYPVIDSFAKAIDYEKSNANTLMSKASNHAFISEHHVSERLSSLFKWYQTKMMKVDTNLTVEFSHDILSIDSFYKAGTTIHGSWNSISCIDLMLLLSQLRNRIFILEQMTVEFCSKKIASPCGLHYTKYALLTTLSATTLKPNEKLKVFATFSENDYYKTRPNFYINGKLVTLDNEGVTNYHFKVPQVPGKFSIPVSVKYRNPYTGKEEKETQKVSYTVKE